VDFRELWRTIRLWSSEELIKFWNVRLAGVEVSAPVNGMYYIECSLGPSKVLCELGISNIFIS